MTARQKQKAIETLYNMSEVVRNDMLVKGHYITPVVVDEQLARKGSVCGGRRACAIGSLWLAGGVKWSAHHQTLPHTSEGYRTPTLMKHPHIRIALDALNEAAYWFGEKHPELNWSAEYSTPIESLFEGGLGAPWETDDGYDWALWPELESMRQTHRKYMLSVIAKARRIVAAA